MILADTTFLIDLLNGRRNAIELVKKLKGYKIVTSSINVFEVMLGLNLMKVKSEERIEKFMNLINNLDILPFDFECCDISSKITSNLIKTGEKIDDLDGLIAGIMLNNDCFEIVTNDTHFSRIKGIKAIKY